MSGDHATRPRGLAALLSLAAIVTLASGCAAAPSPDATSWWSHVQALAADSMRGRATGTPDYDMAARYVAAQFRAHGVRPAGSDPRAADSAAEYLQSVPFLWRRLREPECAVALVRDGVPAPLELGKDATLGLVGDSPDSIAAPIVFVGYGVSMPEAGYDDLAGLDLSGKIAAYIRGAPDTLTGPLRAHAQAFDIRWAALRAKGAIGLLSVSAMTRREGGWERFAKQRLQPGVSMDDAALDETRGLRVSARLNAARFGRLLEGSGHTPEELFALADSGRKLPTFPLAVGLEARLRFDRRHVESPNVVGIVPGSDPKLRDQYVVVSAHLDHLGVGVPVDGDSIFNGAMDNASGVASLIEFARYARSVRAPFRRSVILLAVTGEEEGLYGSKWYAVHPTVPAGSIVADINLDMFLPVIPLHAITVYGQHESDLGPRFAQVAKRADLLTVDDPQPRQNYFTRSDQYSFIRKGVPALFFEFGAADSDTVASGALRRWNRSHYHQPSDDLNQPVNLEGAAAFTRLLFEFTREVANADAPPRWAPDSFFRRFAPAGSPSLAGEVATAAHRAAATAHPTPPAAPRPRRR